MWPIIEEVVRAGDTFPYPTDLTEDEARRSGSRTAPAAGSTVALVGDRRSARRRWAATAPAPGRTSRRRSYMVAAEARGLGVGRALVVDSLDWARESGYAAMQFNAVVATNTGAVKLYESLGFTVVGTVPRAHELPSGERVGLRIMHVDLDRRAPSPGQSLRLGEHDLERRRCPRRRANMS